MTILLQAFPPADRTACVIEVTDSSLERDRDEKGPVYARAGIAQYIIINLRNRTAEVYLNPDLSAGKYVMPIIVTDQQQIALQIGSEELLSIDLTSLLP